MDDDQWRKRLEQERMDRSEAFKEHPRSPVPEHERARFGGLAYFPPDPAYRLTLTLEPMPPETITVPRTAGDEVTYTKAGRFTLALPRGTGTVTLYTQRHADHEHLFLPIKDATSGKATYGAGRYLDPEPLDDDRYLVDLNQLYNPFCVFNEAYACPMTPPENWLPFPIEAGEKLPVGYQP